MAKGLTGVLVHGPLALTRSGSGPSLILLFFGMNFCLLSIQPRTFFDHIFLSPITLFWKSCAGSAIAMHKPTLNLAISFKTDKAYG